jgi:hypothetical protein
MQVIAMVSGSVNYRDCPCLTLRSGTYRARLDPPEPSLLAWRWMSASCRTTSLLLMYTSAGVAWVVVGGVLLGVPRRGGSGPGAIGVTFAPAIEPSCNAL